MPIGFIIFSIVTAVIMITIILVVVFGFWLPNYKSIMNRARKIDPSVKTFAEANYVLQKDVMKSVGQNGATDKENNENK